MSVAASTSHDLSNTNSTARTTSASRAAMLSLPMAYMESPWRVRLDSTKMRIAGIVIITIGMSGLNCFRCATDVTVPVDDLLAAVKRVSLLGSDQFGRAVQLDLSKKKLELSSKTEVGECHTPLCRQHGLQVPASAEYVLEGYIEPGEEADEPETPQLGGDVTPAEAHLHRPASGVQGDALHRIYVNFSDARPSGPRQIPPVHPNRLPDPRRARAGTPTTGSPRAGRC